MRGIKLNENTEIKLDTLIDTRLLIQANSGGGKSWLIRRILEQSHGKVQHLVIDMEGEFSTLREKYDYVIAGKDGDTPAEPQSAGLLARKLLELNVSAIIDLYELSHIDRRRFVRLFLDALINAPKALWHPCLVVLDEAHVFCPEKGQSEASNAVIDLATRGRKRGYCAILATQRLSKLHKDAAAECNNKLIGRTGLDVDMKRASEELGFNSREQYLSLRDLEAGDFFAFGPAISRAVTKVKVGDVITSHPKAGLRILTALPTPPTDNIRKILAELKGLPQEALEEARNIEELKLQNARLKEQLRTSSAKRASTGPTLTEIEQAVNEALKKQQQDFQAHTLKLSTRVNELEQALGDIVSRAGQALETPSDAPITKAIAPKPMLVQEPAPPSVDKLEQPQEKGSDQLSSGAVRILHVLASRHPTSLTIPQLATLAKLSKRSGTFTKYISQLKSQGYIIVEGGQVLITSKGMRVAGSNPRLAPQTPEQVINMWQGTLTGGARRIFNLLVEQYPDMLTRAEVGKRTQLSSRSGTFSSYLSHLRSNGLIEETSGSLKASDNLFV
jgi:uncharacterized protein